MYLCHYLLISVHINVGMFRSTNYYLCHASTLCTPNMRFRKILMKIWRQNTRDTESTPAKVFPMKTRKLRRLSRTSQNCYSEQNIVCCDFLNGPCKTRLFPRSLISINNGKYSY